MCTQCASYIYVICNCNYLPTRATDAAGLARAHTTPQIAPALEPN